MRALQQALVPAAIGLIVFTAPVAPAAAAGCAELTEQMAHDLDLAIVPMQDSGQVIGEVTPEELAETGGLIVPPPVVDDPAVIEPPAVGSEMATLPDVTDTPPTPDLGISAADLAVLETTLIAARAEALRGNEGDCIVQLQKASELFAAAVSDPSGTAPPAAD